MLIDLTPYSILSVTVVTSIFITLFICITYNEKIVSKIPMGVAMALLFVMCLRLLFPIEFLFFSNTLLSFDVFPQIDNVFYADIPFVNNIIPRFKFTIVGVFCIIWLIGAVVFIINYILMYGNLCKYTKYIMNTTDTFVLDTLNKLKKEYNFKFDVKIIVSEAVEGPCEFGFFRQTILLDKAEYTEIELRYILLHELTHFYNKTNWIKLFMELMKSVLWWNPIVYLLQRHIENLIEMYVDIYVIKGKKFDYRLGYLNCIHKVFKNSVLKRNKSIISNRYVHSMANKKKLRRDIMLRRCGLIVMDSKIKINIPICISIFLLLFTYIFISSRYVVQPAYEPDAGDLTHPEFTSENSYIVKEGDWYILYYNDEPFFSNYNIDNFPDVPIIDK